MPPWHVWAAWLAAGALLLLAIPSIARFVGTSGDWLNYPYPRPGSEGLILYESLLSKHGGNVYAPITPDRFISGPYPPIYYWLAVLVLPDHLPDFSSPQTVTSIFAPGRTISLVAAITAALLIVSIVTAGGYAVRDRRRLLCGIIGGAVGATIFLAMPQVEVWATRFRGDMLMIALTAGGLACISATSSGTSDDNRLGWPWLVAGAALFSLAFFTKQTAVAGPIAAALFLLARDWRSGLKWCALMFALVIVPFAALDLATAHWFYLKMVDYHSLPLRSLTLERLLQFAFWEDQWPVILLAIAYALLSALTLRGVSRPPPTGPTERTFLSRLPRLKVDNTLLIPFFVLAALTTLPTGAVVGADHNHLLMPGLAVSLGVGAPVAFLLNYLTTSESPVPGQPWNRSRSTYTLSAAVSAVLIGLYLLVTSPPSSWYNPDLTVPPPEQQEQLRKIVLNIQQNPGALFFADDPGMLALAGKETPYDDPFTMTALAEQGRWDESAYRNQIGQGKFALLVLSCDVTSPNSCRGDTFTPGVLDAIRDGYTILFRDILYTYVPK